MVVKRAIALFIDWVALLIIGWIIGMILGSDAIGGLLAFVIGIIYQVFFLTTQNGQTPGKKIMGIRVVMMDGGPIGPVQAALRYVGYYINTLLIFTGWILAGLTGRGFHDYIAGTQVVDA